MNFKRAVIILAWAGFAVGLFFLAKQFFPFWLKAPNLILPVPPGDQEIVWIHTSTNSATWERFVTATHRVPGIQVDDSRAFLSSTTSIPEIILTVPGNPHRLLIRWYKLTAVTKNPQIIDALAKRQPAPLAIIGGGSTDRAVDLANTLASCKIWKGVAPLLLMTTATGVEIPGGTNHILDPEKDNFSTPAPRLMQIYPGRSFRFCFTNEQIARAVLDFVWETHMIGNNTLDLVPHSDSKDTPIMFSVAWEDDPYSTDLSEYFRRIVRSRETPLQIKHQNLPYSVGSYNVATHWEAEAATQIAQQLPLGKEYRSLLVIPTTAPPARRLLKSLRDQVPLVGKSLIAVNGDGIAFNVFYRDADIAWPIRDLSIPFVFFMHQNPVAWDEEDSPINPDSESSPTKKKPSSSDFLKLLPPNSTEDVLLFADMLQRLTTSIFTEDNDIIRSADQLRTKLHDKNNVWFNNDGDRIGGSGEYIGVVLPEFDQEGRIAPQAIIQVWRRQESLTWELIKTLKR